MNKPERKNHSWQPLNPTTDKCKHCPCQRTRGWLDEEPVTQYHIPGVGIVYHSPPCTNNLQSRPPADELYSVPQVEAEQIKIDFNKSFVRQLKFERLVLVPVRR